VGHRDFFAPPILRVFDLRLIGWLGRGYDAGATDANTVIQK